MFILNYLIYEQCIKNKYSGVRGGYFNNRLYVPVEEFPLFFKLFEVENAYFEDNRVKQKKRTRKIYSLLEKNAVTLRGITTDPDIVQRVRNADTLKKRWCYNSINQEIINGSSPFICIYGLYNTGKTTLMLQLMRAFPYTSTFITCSCDMTTADINKKIAESREKGYELLFFDDITRVQDLNFEKIKTNNAKIIFTCNSLVSIKNKLPKDVTLFNTSYVSYAESKYLLGHTLRDYIRNGGVLSDILTDDEGVEIYKRMSALVEFPKESHGDVLNNFDGKLDEHSKVLTEMGMLYNNRIVQSGLSYRLGVPEFDVICNTIFYAMTKAFDLSRYTLNIMGNKIMIYDSECDSELIYEVHMTNKLIATDNKVLYLGKNTKEHYNLENFLVQLGEVYFC